MANLDTQEYELTLVVIDEEPDRLIKTLAGLDFIGDYKLLNKGQRIIKDFYLNTPDSHSDNERLSMRLRESDSQYSLTIKGPARMNNWGAIERFELELPWSLDSLNRIFSELANRGINLKTPGIIYEDMGPLDILLNSGLKVIQHREANRHIRIATLDGKKDLAEIDIDSVIYHFREKDILHYEVEIEVKGQKYAETLKDLKDILINTYKPNFRVWNYGKLTTGIAIENLINEGFLAEFIGVNNTLKPDAYKIIEYRIKL
ncbi:CYTH domain-containing protein [Candidatus Poribacteria bacterium]|nr:CYTH domain-containing protein [Candidatus Poribacteria bacterium]